MPATGEEASLPPEPARLNHSSEHRVGPSIVCQDKAAEPRIELRGEKYWVLYNYVRASESFHCNETITLTTHGSHSFMDNLFPLLERWQVRSSRPIFN